MVINNLLTEFIDVFLFVTCRHAIPSAAAARTHRASLHDVKSGQLYLVKEQTYSLQTPIEQMCIIIIMNVF